VTLTAGTICLSLCTSVGFYLKRDSVNAWEDQVASGRKIYRNNSAHPRGQSSFYTRCMLMLKKVAFPVRVLVSLIVY
jgi:hypothetical protein